MEILKKSKCGFAAKAEVLLFCINMDKIGKNMVKETPATIIHEA